jgi:NAD-dependent DNA ligase
LIERIGRVLDDGVMDADEEGDLVQLLMQIEGGRITDATSASMSTTLPVDEPPPTITFIGSNFCVTGKFACGSRREVENTIQNLGGTVVSSVSARTTYLVIGEIGSRDWIHSTYGRKIEHAMELRNTGHSLAIIAESWWYQATKGNLISEHP